VSWSHCVSNPLQGAKFHRNVAFNVSHNGRASVHTIWALKDFLSLLEKYSSCEKGVLEIGCGGGQIRDAARAMLSDLSLDALDAQNREFLIVAFRKVG